jgi:hypothetical protein
MGRTALLRARTARMKWLLVDGRRGVG